jgi:hypothetical protein
MKWVVLFGLLLSAFSLLSCTPNAEMNDLSLAQQCLDQVPTSDPQSATNCMQYVNQYSSQQANVLKCGIYLTAGGITTSRIEQAYSASQNTSITASQQQAMYISFLALTLPDAATGYTNALTASSYCEASGESGLIFESAMAVIGSKINSLAGGLNLNDTPANISTAVQSALANCQTTPSNCDPTTIAPIVTTAATAYCATSSSNTAVCADVNQAVNTWGSDPNTMTQGLTCILQGKTFTPPSTCS